MEDVLLEKSIRNAPGEPYKTRVLSDGQLQTWSNSKYVIEPDGSSRFESQEAIWRTEAQLTPEQIDKLKAVIQGSGFFELNSLYESQDTGVKDGTEVVWSVSVDGRQHQVALAAGQTTELVALQQLDETLQVIMAECAAQA